MKVSARLEHQEWKQIQKFVAECRRQWPGAAIVLRPDTTTDAAAGAHADQHPKPLRPTMNGKQMSDEFPETDLNTPTEHDLDEAYGSKFLGVVDVGDRKIRTRISKVGKDEVKDCETGKMKKKILVFFENIDKALVLNATNKNILVDSLGRVPANWKGASVGIFNDPTVTFAGKRTGGLRLKVLLPPAKPKAAEAAPRPSPTAAEFPEEKGDPGFDPDLNDPVPDFTAA